MLLHNASRTTHALHARTHPTLHLHPPTLRLSRGRSHYPSTTALAPCMLLHAPSPLQQPPQVTLDDLTPCMLPLTSSSFLRS